MVLRLYSFCRSAASATTRRTSSSLAVTAESAINSASSFWAIKCARVDLPDPGGPQKMSEGKFCEAISLVIIPFSPTRCDCPINSGKLFGRSCSASGANCIRLLYRNIPESQGKSGWLDYLAAEGCGSEKS